MADIRHLPNAPITEALIDIRVKLPSGFKVAVFENIVDNSIKNYPIRGEITKYGAKLGIKDKKSFVEAHDLVIDGILYKSKDEKNIVQFKRSGFTFNRLKPYTQWEEIVGNAKDLWNLYVKYAEPVKITRIATRYINFIRLPDDNFDDYMVSPPHIAEGIPDKLTGYLRRLNLREASTDIQANVTQAIEESTEKNMVTLILDIEAYINKMQEPDSEQIWDNLEDLRTMKNRVFFNSLTEKTIQLFL